jgi:CRISPR system Cascade subunit CasA
VTRIEALLIDSPGANGQKKNSDLLTHRNRYPVLGLPAAAMALYALQQFVPSGGAGNRTSLRGGGPLTTLVVPGSNHGRPALWRTILANLVARPANDFQDEDLPKILPWLTPTLVSDKENGNGTINEGDPQVHALQCFFGMPRRIELHVDGSGACPTTGRDGPLVTGFVQKPWGVSYGLWQHPLTPYRRQKEADPPYSTKPKSSLFVYRDWTAVTVAGENGPLAETAFNVRSARRARRELLRGGGSDAALAAGGWVMNNMEAVTYLAAYQPLHLASSDAAQDALDHAAIRFAAAADDVSGLMVRALRAALFDARAKPGASRRAVRRPRQARDTGLFEEARTSVYERSENAFHAALDALLNDASADEVAIAKSWLATLAGAARAVFASHAPVPVDNAERAGRIAAAFDQLQAALLGRGPQGSKLYQRLGLEQNGAASANQEEGA